MTILGDALKAVVAIFIGWCIMGMHFGGGYLAALLCIVGHVYPCYFKFKGGKGVVTSAVAVLMLNPPIFLIIITVFILVVITTRYISLGSVIGAALYPLLIYVTVPVRSRGFAFLFAFIIACFVIYLHRDNLKRLAHGTESKFSFKSKNQSENKTEKNEK